jgi:flavin reductase (DIM6/NTAB) family NADH-FMN oxidoreductase RutF
MSTSAPTSAPESAVSAAPPDFDSVYFRRALSQFATGIAVVITRTPDGEAHGLTVNSFSSVSLEPPLVLWSLANKARSMPAFMQASHYIVNVLGEHQADLALRFSQKVDDRFEALAFDLSRTGLPILQGAVAWFECRNRSRYQEGDHVILVGQVERCHVNAHARALGFHGGRFVAIPSSGTQT